MTDFASYGCWAREAMEFLRRANDRADHRVEFSSPEVGTIPNPVWLLLRDGLLRKVGDHATGIIVAITDPGIDASGATP